MKREHAQHIGFVILVIVVVGALTVLLNNNDTQLTGNVIFTPEGLSDCSDASVLSVWDSVFSESSDGVLVSLNENNGSCDGYTAYKVKGSQLFYLSNSNEMGDGSSADTTVALVGSFNQAFLDGVSSGSKVLDVMASGDSFDYSLPYALSDVSIAQNNSFDNLAQSFASAFKANATFEDASSTLAIGGATYYYFADSEAGDDGTVYLVGASSDSYDHVFLVSRSVEDVSSVCVSDWQVQNSSCGEDERMVMYSSDANNCGNEAPANETFPCDYDGNNVIATAQELNDLSYELHVGDAVVMNGSNDSFSGQENVSFYSDGKEKVRFVWDFSTPLNVRDIILKAASDDDGLNYVIINGLSANKTVVIEKGSEDSESVCIKNSDISSVNEISSDCGGDDEVLVPCPGAVEGISCSVNGGNTFIVSGLNHSAVTEYIAPVEEESSSENNQKSEKTITGDAAACDSDWVCDEWNGECVDGIESRVCVDNNGCADSFTQKRDCSSECAPDWSCDEWAPVDCSDGEQQTRICVDNNNCGVETGKPTESQECSPSEAVSSGSSAGKTVAWAVFIVVLAALCVVSFVFARKKGALEKVKNIFQNAISH